MKVMTTFVQATAIAAAVCAFATVSTAQAQNDVTAQVGSPTPPPPPPPRGGRRHHVPPSPAPAVAPAPAAEMVATPPPAPMSPAADVRHAFNFDAFVDGNARITSRNYLYDNQSDLNRGFSIKSGALILTGDLSKQTRAVIELPFFTATDATTNALRFAQGYAQAYAAYTMAAVPLTFKMGQYASFFGLEANDSRDRFFTQESAAKTFITPWTHTGAQVGWASSGATKFSVLGQVANSNTVTSGTNSIGALGDNNVEIGAQGRIDTGAAYGALGVSYSKAQMLPTTSNETIDSSDTNMLIELMGGMNIGSFNWGLQLDSKKTAGFKDSAFAVTLLGAYQLNADLGFGARLQDLSNTVGAMTVGGNASTIEIKSGYGIAVGPSYKLDNNLTIRGDLNYNSIKADNLNNGASKGYFGANFSVVATL